MGWGYTPDDKVYEKLPWVHTRVIPGWRLVLLLLARGDHAGAVVVRQAAARHREGELAGGGALHTRARRVLQVTHPPRPRPLPLSCFSAMKIEQ